MSSTGIISLLISIFRFIRFSAGSEEEGPVVVVIEGSLCATNRTALVGTRCIPSECTLLPVGVPIMVSLEIRVVIA